MAETPLKARATASAARAAKEEAETRVQELRDRLDDKRKEWALEEAKFFDQIERAKACKRKCDEDDAAAQSIVASAKRRRTTVGTAPIGHDDADQEATTFEASDLEASDLEADLEAEVQATAAALALEMRGQQLQDNIFASAAKLQSNDAEQPEIAQPCSEASPSAASPELQDNTEERSTPQSPSGSASDTSSQLPQSSSPTADVLEALHKLSRSPSDAMSDSADLQQPRTTSAVCGQLGSHLAHQTLQPQSAAAPFEGAVAYANHVSHPVTLSEAAAKQLSSPKVRARPATSAPSMAEQYSRRTTADVYVPCASATGRLEGPASAPDPSWRLQQEEHAASESRPQGAAVKSSKTQPSKALKAMRRRSQWQDPKPVLMTGKRDRKTSVRVKKYNEEVPRPHPCLTAWGHSCARPPTHMCAQL